MIEYLDYLLAFLPRLHSGEADALALSMGVTQDPGGHNLAELGQ